MGHVMYSSDGQGNWWRTEWKDQCSEKVYLLGKCQGVRGHKNIHWCFGPDGSFQWSDNKDDPREDGCTGSTPPSHKRYKSPQVMERHYYMRHRKTRRVRDKAVLAKLEKDKTPEKDASINRPV